MEQERKVYNTRPDGEIGSDEKIIYDILENLDIKFERMERLESDNETQEVYRMLGIRRLKNLLLCNHPRTKFYLLVMPADVPFKSSVLSSQLGTSRFSFAEEEYLAKFLHARSGTSTLLGLVFDTEKAVQLVVDTRVMEDETFGCLPCVSDTSLKFDRKELFEKLLSYTGHQYKTVTM